MVSYKAVETEYKGVKFRSKCEAMFAKYMDIDTECREFLAKRNGTPFFFPGSSGNHSGGYIYEPEMLSIDGWSPDFLRWTVLLTPELGPQLDVQIIEYKPTRPTDSYIKRLSERYRILALKTCKLWMFCSFELYYGSIYSNDRGMLIRCETTQPTWLQDDWLSMHEDEIASTRFDLEQGE